MIPPRRHLPSLPSPIPGAPHCGCDTLQCNSPVWKRDFSTSGGMATTQLKIPARPPAKRILGTLRSLTLWQDQSGVGGKSKKKMKKGKKIKLIVLTKVTIKKTAWVAARRQHNAAETECSIWATFSRWTNSTLKIQIFLFSSTHTHALGKKKKPTSQPTNQTPKFNKAPQHFVHIQGWKWRGLL